MSPDFVYTDKPNGGFRFDMSPEQTAALPVGNFICDLHEDQTGTVNEDVVRKGRIPITIKGQTTEAPANPPT